MDRLKRFELRLLLPLVLGGFMFISGCVDPFYPDIHEYKSMLVVDGLITDENISYKVILSRTYEEKDIPPVMVTDAAVTITDNDGINETLANLGNGVYATDSTRFRGIVGKKYTLHIRAADGSQYESSTCTMYPVSPIDSVYFRKDEELIPNQVAKNQGIRIYLATKTFSNTEYVRWVYGETWKFKIPYPVAYQYFKEDSIVQITVNNEYCWKSSQSKEILIYASNPAFDHEKLDQPLIFISSNGTDKLSLQYSILVKQYSLSPGEYDFWDYTRKVTESGSNIFGFQPFSVTGNIYNLNNKEEKVLGYFQVSSVSEVRKYITFNEIVGMGLPYYRNVDCKSVATSPRDYPLSSPFAEPLKFDDIYEMYVSGKDYVFVEPVYGSQNTLQKLVFTKPGCADCSLTGNIKKPDFWIDLF